MRLMVRFVTLGVLIALLPSQADAKGASAKELFRKAEGHYSESRYLDALDLYRMAYKKRPLPGFYINMGQCLRQLLRWKEAVAAFEKYLQLAPKGKHREKAKALIVLCKKELKKLGGPKPVEATPTVPAAKPEVPPAAPPAAASPAPAAPAAPAAPVAPAEPVASQPAVAAEVDPADQTPPSRRGLSKIYFWSGVGLSAALLVTTAITGAMALSKSDEYKDPATPAAELQDLKDSGEALSTTSSVMFAVGMVAAAGTAVLFFFTDWRGAAAERDDDAEESISMGAAPLYGGAMLSVGGRF